MPLLLDLERVDTMVVANLRTEALGITRCLAGIHGFLVHVAKLGAVYYGRPQVQGLKVMKFA